MSLVVGESEVDHCYRVTLLDCWNGTGACALAVNLHREFVLSAPLSVLRWRWRLFSLKLLAAVF